MEIAIPWVASRVALRAFSRCRYHDRRETPSASHGRILLFDPSADALAFRAFANPFLPRAAWRAIQLGRCHPRADQLLRYRSMERAIAELIPVAVQSGYHRNKFEGHLGNVG